MSKINSTPKKKKVDPHPVSKGKKKKKSVKATPMGAGAKKKAKKVKLRSLLATVAKLVRSSDRAEKKARAKRKGKAQARGGSTLTDEQRKFVESFDMFSDQYEAAKRERNERLRPEERPNDKRRS